MLMNSLATAWAENAIYINTTSLCNRNQVCSARAYTFTMNGKPENSEHENFTTALASVLSASPKQIQDAIAQAKAEKPSPHTKYSFDPEEGQP